MTYALRGAWVAPRCVAGRAFRSRFRVIGFSHDHVPASPTCCVASALILL